MEEYIGIIVKNESDKILLYENSFYILKKIKPGEEVKNIIKKEIDENLNKDMFKIKKIYDEKLIQRDKIITLYLVEVGIYNNEFEFMNIEKIKDEIINFDDKAYFEKNILRYEDCNNISYNIFTIIMYSFCIDILPKINIAHDIDIFWGGISSIIIIYFIYIRYISPKVRTFLINSKINIKLTIYIVNFIILIYSIRLIFIAIS